MGGAYSVGGYSVGVGGNDPNFAEVRPTSILSLSWDLRRSGFTLRRNIELAELKVQWLLLDFGRRLGRYQQARLANDIAALQTDRAFQTVANDVAVAYYNVLQHSSIAADGQGRPPPH